MPEDNAFSRIVFPAVCILLLFFQTLEAAPISKTWEQLQKEGAVIAGIRVEVQDVFSEDEPESHYWFAPIANTLHIETKTRVVERELLFKVGDRVNATLIHDTERSLGEILDIARDVLIVPERVEGKKVWALVVFKDAWSLSTRMNFGLLGGESKYRFALREGNLLGLGKGLMINHEKNFDRSFNELRYYDPQLFGGHSRLIADYQHLSDGISRFIQLDRPFRTFQTPWAFNLKGGDYDATLTLYTLSQPVYDIRHQEQFVRLALAWAYRISPGGAYRLGVGYMDQETTYSDLEVRQPGLLPLPDLENRSLSGPLLSWEWFDDRYQNFRNMKSIERTEQYNLGWDVNTGLGYYSRSTGSTSNGPFFSVSANKGWLLGSDSLILINSSIHGRHENGQWRNLFLTGEATFYNQSFPLQTLTGYLRLDLALRPDPENWLYLDALEGLRGYPNHFLSGDKRWVMSFEERIITNRTLWGLLQVGFAAFLDVGSIHTMAADRWEKTYANIGAGLRLGNIRMRIDNVIYFAVTAPLVKGAGSNGLQVVAGNQIRF